MGPQQDLMENEKNNMQKIKKRMGEELHGEREEYN